MSEEAKASKSLDGKKGGKKQSEDAKASESLDGKEGGKKQQSTARVTQKKFMQHMKASIKMNIHNGMSSRDAFTKAAKDWAKQTKAAAI